MVTGLFQCKKGNKTRIIHQKMLAREYSGLNQIFKTPRF